MDIPVLGWRARSWQYRGIIRPTQRPTADVHVLWLISIVPTKKGEDLPMRRGRRLGDEVVLIQQRQIEGHLPRPGLPSACADRSGESGDPRTVRRLRELHSHGDAFV